MATVSLKRKQRELEEAAPSLAVKLHGRSTRGRRQGELAGEDAEADQVSSPAASSRAASRDQKTE